MRAPALFFLLGLGLPALAGEAVDTRAAELARLRREVETLADEVQFDKEELRGRLRALEGQKLEIEVQLRREELRLAQIEGEGAGRRAELVAHSASTAPLAPALAASIAAIRAEVAQGLPYRQAERIAELDKLKAQLDQGDLSVETGAARLWAFTEDELRLRRENALDRQIIPLPEGEVLVEVARLGMVALYYRTDGGQVGAAQRKGEQWVFRPFTDRDDQHAVETLFETLRHGVRTGAFTLPNPDAGSPP